MDQMLCKEFFFILALVTILFSPDQNLDLHLPLICQHKGLIRAFVYGKSNKTSPIYLLEKVIYTVCSSVYHSKNLSCLSLQMPA